MDTLASGQSTPLKVGKSWKLYNVTDENAFQYRIDTLRNFSSLKMSNDTMESYMSDITELSSEGPHIWMGAYISTCEVEGVVHKVEISHYGGIIYDESTKKHYQVAENKIEYWQSFIRQSFLEFSKK